MESEPVQGSVRPSLTMTITIPAIDITSARLAVDLVPLERAFQALYGARHGTVEIPLAGSDIILEYTF